MATTTKEWCPGYFTELTAMNVQINGFGTCAVCGKWCKSTKNSVPYAHKRVVDS